MSGDSSVANDFNLNEFKLKDPVRSIPRWFKRTYQGCNAWVFSIFKESFRS